MDNTPRPYNHVGLPADFLATLPHYLDHIVEIWRQLSASGRGKFYVPARLMDYARFKGVEPSEVRTTSPISKDVILPTGPNPIVTSAYVDMAAANQKLRTLIFMQHGIGMSFYADVGTRVRRLGYAGGGGMQQYVNLFLSPNKYTENLILKQFPNALDVVVGVPKMDKWVGQPKPLNSKPKVVISFHWQGHKVTPEMGDAFEHFESALPLLSREFDLYGHAHPKVALSMKAKFESMGIPYIATFDEVLRTADLYINDASSTIYEFCFVNRPVVIMNAPWFRRNVNHGIRFWDYSNVGINCDDPKDLVLAAAMALEDKDMDIVHNRIRAVKDLFPYAGDSARRAAEIIEDFSNNQKG
jgi:hypothetical protein